MPYSRARVMAGSCALRRRTGETELDPEYKVELAELTEGRVVGGLAPARKGALFFRIEPDVKINADSDVSGVWPDAVWTSQRWDLATGASSRPQACRHQRPAV
jgi:hypothetical protein